MTLRLTDYLITRDGEPLTVELHSYVRLTNNSTGEMKYFKEWHHAEQYKNSDVLGDWSEIEYVDVIEVQ